MNASPLRNAVGGIHVNPIWPKVFSPCDKHANLPVVLRKGVNTEIAYGIIETSFSNLAGQRKQERGVASNTATITHTISFENRFRAVLIKYKQL